MRITRWGLGLFAAAASTAVVMAFAATALAQSCTVGVNCATGSVSVNSTVGEQITLTGLTGTITFPTSAAGTTVTAGSTGNPAESYFVQTNDASGYTLTLTPSSAAAIAAALVTGCGAASAPPQASAPAATTSPTPDPSPSSTMVCQEVKAALSLYSSGGIVTFPNAAIELSTGQAISADAQSIPAGEGAGAEGPTLYNELKILGDGMALAGTSGSNLQWTADSTVQMVSMAVTDITQSCFSLGVFGVFGS